MDLTYQLSLQQPPAKTKSKPRYWNEEEDTLLRAAIKQHGSDGYHTWKEVAKHVPNRTYRECMQRWTKVLAPGLKKGKWSADEDRLLIQLVTEQLKNLGEDAKQNPNKRIVWNRVSEGFNGRSCKQCRERWINHLDPSVKKTEWTKDEDLLLIQLSKNLPNKWAKIARQIPGRTENMVKVRWNALHRQARKRKQNLMFISQINTNGKAAVQHSGLGKQDLKKPLELPNPGLIPGGQNINAQPPPPGHPAGFYHNVNNINNINIYSNPNVKTETGRNLSIHSDIFKTEQNADDIRKNSLYFLPNYESMQPNPYLGYQLPYGYQPLQSYPYYFTPLGPSVGPQYSFPNLAAATAAANTKSEDPTQKKVKLTSSLSDEIGSSLRRLSFPLTGLASPSEPKNEEPQNNRINPEDEEENPRRLSSLLYRDFLSTQEHHNTLSTPLPNQVEEVGDSNNVSVKADTSEPAKE